MENKYIKNYRQFETALAKSTDITPSQLKIGKKVTLRDEREGVIVGVAAKSDEVMVKFKDGKTEDVKITEFK